MDHLTESFDYKFEIAAVGNVSSGKTCLFNRYFKDIFEKVEITLNFNLFTKSYKLKDGNNNISVFVTATDTSGEEKFRSMTKTYVLNKQCLIFVYSVADQKSFDGLQSWYDWADNYISRETVKILVGT